MARLARRILDALMQVTLDLRASLPLRQGIALVWRSSGEAVFEARREAAARQAMAAGIAVFNDLPDAAPALGALQRRDAFRLRHGLIAGDGGAAAR